MRSLLITAAALALAVMMAACGAVTESADTSASPVTAGAPSLPQGGRPVELHPADFVAGIDNPYWPMAPGSRWVYHETDREGNHQRVEVVVTEAVKTILGIEATVVHDVVTQNGRVKEDTWDWYAQDTRGNVWYLGEDTKEFEHGKVVSTAGSWEAGVDGAQAGIVIPADPEVGQAYRQEYYAGEAEDRARVLSLDEMVEVPFGSFDGVLLTSDTTPLHPEILEHKLYAKGIGPVAVIGLSGGSGREELVEYRAAA